MTAAERLLRGARQRFYRHDGPWLRCRAAEALGSRRYSRPALHAMDRRLAELMPWRGGTFVEAGAHDGYTQSNTYFLERHRGWSGVLVEPVPELRVKCERRRPRAQVFGCALVGPDHVRETVAMHFGDLTSTADDPAHTRPGLDASGREGYSVEVPARTLSAVLDAAGLERIDVMVLDLEGLELAALAGLDFERHSPEHLLIEALERDLMQPRFDSVLADRYELAEAPSDWDLLYRRRG